MGLQLEEAQSTTVRKYNAKAGRSITQLLTKSTGNAKQTKYGQVIKLKDPPPVGNSSSKAALPKGWHTFQISTSSWALMAYAQITMESCFEFSFFKVTDFKCSH